MRFGFAFRVALVALLVFAIVGEETASGKGSPITFQAEVSKMLDILINSLYTNRSIFLREIISNASDALDKIRFLYLTAFNDPKSDAGEAPTMDIRIRMDKEARQFIMRDGGIGMTKDELAANLGSLGSSGTKRFLEKMNDAQNTKFIGQFGVGFYSVFLVADRVRVASKHDDSEKQWVWESTGDGTYFLYEDPRGNTLGRGTELTLDLKVDADEYLDTEKVRDLVHKYSEFIHFPIYLETLTKETVKVAKDEAEDKDEGDDAEKEPKAEEETEEITKAEWKLVNENKPIWTRKPQDISDEEYLKFYRVLTRDDADPLYYTHFSVEGEVEFRSILFIPASAPENVFDATVTAANIRLYVRRVFITDEFRDLLPRYLNFIKGVVDSDDLPLNVSREVLQESRILRVIKKKLVRKALGMIADIARSDKELKDKEKDSEAEKDGESSSEKEDSSAGSRKLSTETYPRFWDEYGKHIRLGMIEDGSNRARLTKLLRYKSSKSDGKLTSLEEYVSRMTATQKSIYYISGESEDKIKQSPVMTDATSRDLEVLYLLDPIDEYVVTHVTDFADKKLVNLAKEGVKFDDESKKDKKIDAKRKEKYEAFTKWYRNLVGIDNVVKVVITKRQTSEAVLVTTPQHEPTARMARIIRSQTLSDKQREPLAVHRVLEINHRHPLIDDLFKRVTVDSSDKTAQDIGMVLYDTANLQSGYDISDSLEFSRRIGRLLRQSIDIAADAPLIEEDLSQYEEEDVAKADVEAPAAAADASDEAQPSDDGAEL